MPLRDMDREQMWLLPPSLDELLPLDHPARFVAVFVDALDKEGWAELWVEIDGDPLGAPAYHPRALLCVWLYGFMTGVRSCRKLEAACRDQIPYLWLTGWQHPDHNTLWRFYKEHRQAMRRLFKRTVRTAVAMQLVDLAVQAVDGTKVAANATRDRTYDAERGRRLLDRLEQAIEDLEAQNEGGEDAPAVYLPEELADKRALREQVRQAMDDLASQEGLRHINLTDKDARLMKTRHGIVPGYNAQSMVSPTEVDDEASGMLITAVDVVDEPTDYGQFTPMLEPPIYPKTPGHLPCSSLTHPLPLSSRRPSVSFGGFGLKLTYVLVELGDKGFLSLPVSSWSAPKIPPAPSISALLQVRTWLGWTSNLPAISAVVSSPLSASRATLALARIHRRRASGQRTEVARRCSCASGIMVLQQKPDPRKGAPNRCYHATTPTASKSPSTTTAWWPMLACSCRPPSPNTWAWENS